jgi:hypothetical protein
MKKTTSLISFIHLFPRIKQNSQNIDTSWKIFSVINFNSEFHTFLLNLNTVDFWIKLKAFEKIMNIHSKMSQILLLSDLSLPQSHVSCEHIFFENRSHENQI